MSADTAPPGRAAVLLGARMPRPFAERLQARFDVFGPLPPPFSTSIAALPDVPIELLALPNGALTPHVGGGTLEAQAAMQEMVVANIDAFLGGRPVATPVPGAQAAGVPVAAG